MPKHHGAKDAKKKCPNIWTLLFASFADFNMAEKVHKSKDFSLEAHGTILLLNYKSLHCNFVTTFTSVSKHHLDTSLFLHILQKDFNLAEKLRKKKEKVGFSFALERTIKEVETMHGFTSK